MQTVTVLFMLFILTVLWGGFGLLLFHSMSTEKKRRIVGDSDE